MLFNPIRSRLVLLMLAVLVTGSCERDWNNPYEGEYHSFTDYRDNRIYHYLVIGDQGWMTENLAWLPSVSTANMGSESEPHQYVYGYNNLDLYAAISHTSYQKYGVLYNWEAAKTACPTGWHLPSDAEWTHLTTYLVDNLGMKMKSTSGWSGNGNGSNSSGFNAKPGGIRSSNGSFVAVGSQATFWSSTSSATGLAWYRTLTSNWNGVSAGFDQPAAGYSVRCVKD